MTQHELAERIALEHKITKAVIKGCIDKGYFLNVDNGGGEMEMKAPGQVHKEISEHAIAADDARIYLYLDPKSAKPFGWIYLVFGNDGYDLVSDYTTNLDSLHVLDDADAIAKPYWA